jgi:hypothetical protein
MKTFSNHLTALFFAAFLLSLPGMNAGAEPVESILHRAETFVGTPYRTGGAAPGGFDCSGFVAYLYRPSLPDIPRISRDMARRGESVEYGRWRPGDLLFFATGSDPSRINHVAIWYGNGVIIHSISDGPETGVVETPYQARYWRKRYVSARRVLPVEASDSTDSTNDAETGVSEERGVNPGKSESESESETETGTAEASPPADNPEESPWNDFEGILRGDFAAWQQADKDAFEAYKKENG